MGVFHYQDVTQDVKVWPYSDIQPSVSPVLLSVERPPVWCTQTVGDWSSCRWNVLIMVLSGFILHLVSPSALLFPVIINSDRPVRVFSPFPAFRQRLWWDWSHQAATLWFSGWRSLNCWFTALVSEGVMNSKILIVKFSRELLAMLLDLVELCLIHMCGMNRRSYWRHDFRDPAGQFSSYRCLHEVNKLFQSP